MFESLEYLLAASEQVVKRSVAPVMPARITRDKKVLPLVNITNVYVTMTPFTSQLCRRALLPHEHPLLLELAIFLSQPFNFFLHFHIVVRGELAGQGVHFLSD